jgi:predicted nucleic acid-binding protein
VKEVVVDASVVLKWFLPDEGDGERALDLLRCFVSGGCHLSAPQLLFYEVVNGLIMAQKRGRVDDGMLITALDGFLDLGLDLVELSAVAGEICKLCLRYGCSAYDGSYLALAESRGVSFVTADKRLYDRVKKDLEWVELLAE